MSHDAEPAKAKPTRTVWVGRVLSGLCVAFLLLVSGSPKLFMPEVALPSMEHLGWPGKHLLTLGVLECTGALLYAVPRTAMLGAIVLTGMLGGAVAAHLRVGDPLLSHTLFPVILGAMMWGGLWLRDERVRRLMPWATRN
ncbi:MAG: DoxX family protein [Candidatus Sericytochromatia bacterium]|nr:DoxX family protein [Candidatus Sericytochromatia bacterium]